jgi:7-carboxy-7-deazaguanine synthase
MLMDICEIFPSISGEGTGSGLPAIFVRLGGCNLSCKWCDTVYANKSSNYTQMLVEDVVDEIKEVHTVKNVIITGGEPLLQMVPVKDLIHRLHMLDQGYHIEIETNGSVYVKEIIPALWSRDKLVIDYKLLSSGMDGEMDRRNFDGKDIDLRHHCEYKFVISNSDDLTQAMNNCMWGNLYGPNVLFSPAYVEPFFAYRKKCQWLWTKIVERKLDVRFQTQLHKVVYDANKRGV